MEKFYAFVGKLPFNSKRENGRGPVNIFFIACFYFIAALFMLLNSASAQTWTRSRPITLTPATTVANYQVKVTITTAIMGNPYTDMNSAGNDIRFYDASYTPCAYWIETFSNAGTSIIWVKVANPSTTIYMYYGNAIATAVSNADNTFDYFEDFKTDISGRWTVASTNGSVTQNTAGTGTVTMSNTSNAGANGISNTSPFTTASTSFFLETKHRESAYHRNRIYAAAANMGFSPTGFDYGYFKNPAAANTVSEVFWNGFSGTNLLTQNNDYLTRWLITDGSTYNYFTYNWPGYTALDAVNRNTTVAATIRYIHFRVTEANNTSITVDWVRVRKSQATDPLTTVGIVVNHSSSPAITAFSPVTSVCVNTDFTINGTNLDNAFLVTVGGTAVNIVSNSSTQIVANSATALSGTVVVQTPLGAVSSAASYTIDALPLIGPILGGATNVCVGSNSPAFTNSNATGTWSVTNGTGQASINTSGILNGISPGTVTVNYEVINGRCTLVNNKAVNIVALPVASLTATETSGIAYDDNIICQGDNVSFTATAGYTNYAFKLNGITVQSGLSNTFNTTALNNGVVVSVEVTNSNSCVITANSITVTVNPIPSALMNVTEGSGIINDNAICVGANVTFQATANAGATFVFKVNGMPMQSGTSNIYSSTTLNNGDQATVEVTKNGCTAVSAVETITVYPYPAGTLAFSENSGTANDGSICIGSNITFTAPQSGNNNFVFKVDGNIEQAGASNIYSTTALTTGPHSVVVEVTSVNGCTTIFDAVLIVVYNYPVVASITGPVQVCEGSSVTLANATSGGNWSSSNPTVATINPSGLVSGISGGTTVISYSVTTNGCETIVTYNFTVNALPTGVITITENSGITANDGIICSGDGINFTAPSGYSNYQFFYGSIEVSNGPSNVWPPALTTGGQVSVVVTTSAGCIASLGPVNFNVNPLPTLSSITGTMNVCVNAITDLDNAQAGGVWSSSNTTIATVNPANGEVTGVSAGMVNINYTYTNANNCSSSVNTIVTVNALPLITLNGPNPICPGSTNNVYTTESGQANYVWTIVGGVITAGGTSTDDNVTVTWNLTGTRTIFVNYTNANGCTATTSATITNAPSTPAPSLSGPSPVCLNSTNNIYTTDAGKIDYDWTVTGGIVTGGGTATDNTITITWNTIGTQSVSINYADAGTGCRSANPTIKNVIVHPLPAATISGTAAVCQNASGIVVTFTGSGGTVPYTFTFNIDGGASQTISTSIWSSSVSYFVPTGTPGIYNYNLESVSDNTGCSNVQPGTATVTVTAQPNASIAYAGSPFCTTSTPVSVNQTGTGGGSYSSSPAGLGINASSGLITPGSSTAGTYTVTYSVAPAGGCSLYTTTTQVTITQAVNPATTISYPSSGSFCSNASLQNVTISGTSGGTFSSTTGLIINASTGQIDPSASTPGNYTVTYEILPAGNCAGFITTTSVSIIQAPSASAGSNMQICSDASNVTIGASASALNYSSVLWTSNGSAGTITNASSLNGATYTPSVADIASGGIILTLIINGNSPCASVQSTITVSITGAATAVAGIDIHACAGLSNVNITAGSSASNYSSVMWSGGAGTWSNATSLTTATYSPTAAEQSAGSVSITLTAIGNSPCGNAFVVKTMYIHPLPTVPVINPASQTMCQGSILPVSSTTVTTSGSATASSGNINQGIPDFNAGGRTSNIAISGIPAGAIIDSVHVGFNITHSRDGDIIINIKAPNNNVLNLVNRRGGNGDNFTSTIISSESLNPVNAGASPFTSTYSADAALGVGATGNNSNVAVFNGLYATANGNWTFSVRDARLFQGGTLNNWNLIIYYHTIAPAPVTWSPQTDLYTDAAATVAYTGSAIATVYVKPSTAGNKIYTATTTDGYGCTRASNFNLTVNPKPVISMNADYCLVPGKVRVSATASPSGTFLWSTGATTSFIDVDEADDYFVTVTTPQGCQSTSSLSVAQELVVNGDFTAGNTGFYTDYTYVPPPGTPTSLYPEGYYAIDVNAHDYHNLFWGKEHSTNAQTGNFMIINGYPGSSTAVIWEQTVTVKPNTDYYFSAWGMNLNPALPAKLRFEVNGVQTGVVADLNLAPKPTNAGQVNINNWIRFYSNPTWNSGSATTAVIRIINLNPALGGNDFGLDDISFGTLSTFIKGPQVVNSDVQNKCVNTPIDEISYQVGTGGTGPLITGLPPGVTTSFNGITLTINGTPTVPGIYNYKIKTQGSCNPDSAVGVIDVKPDATLSLNSGSNNQEICYNSLLNPVTYAVGGGAISANVSGLPTGITGNYSNGTLTISGIALQTGSFNFTVTTTGTCVQKSENGQITIYPVTVAGNLANKVICNGGSGSYTITGITGSVKRWESSTDDGVTWDTISNTTNTQGFSGISQTTIFRAVVQSGVCTELSSTGGKVGIHNMWEGKYSSDWNDPLNWSDGAGANNSLCPSVVIPVIPTGYFYPVLNSGTPNLIVNLDIKTGASVVISNDAMLPIAGAITNAGSFDVTHGGINLNGISTQLVSGSMFLNNTIKTLKFENNVNITAGAGNMLNVTSLVDIGLVNNKTLQTNGNLTLKSSAAVTASMGRIFDNNQVLGDVTVERYIPSGRKWRFLAVPTNTTQSVKDAWQEAAATEASNPVPGFGTQISSYFSNPTTLGFDAFSPGGHSMKYWNEATQQYIPQPTTNVTNINNSKGYMIFIRGDRTSTVSAPTSTTTVLRTKGPLKSKNQSVSFSSVPMNNFVSVGNPYASAIDLRQIGKVNVSDVYYVWDPKLGGSYGLGAFQKITVTGSSFTIIPGGGSYSGLTDPRVESGAAFYVQSAGTGNGSVNFTEYAKTTGSREVNRNGNLTDDRKILKVILETDEGNVVSKLDGVMVEFGDIYSNDVNADDGANISNTGENLAIQKPSRNISVERHAPVIAEDTIKLNFVRPRARNYRFVLDMQNMQNGLQPWLIDNFTQVQLPIEMDGETLYNFAVTTAQGASSPNRFMIIFKQAVTLPVTFIQVNAKRNADRTIAVNWKVANEINITKYEVERSPDGIIFTGILTSDANNASQYAKTDLSPFAAVNYYRIKAFDLDGSVKYSPIVKVVAEGQFPVIAVYPNPVKHKEMQLHFENVLQGKYRVQVLNATGQLLVAEVLNVTGNTIKMMPLHKIASGNYTVTVLDEAGTQIAQQNIFVE